MPDFLIQRFLENIPNSNKGGWQDVALVKGLTASDGQKAAAQAGVSGTLRAIRWDTCEEYTAAPGPTVLDKPKKPLGTVLP